MTTPEPSELMRMVQFIGRCLPGHAEAIESSVDFSHRRHDPARGCTQNVTAGDVAHADRRLTRLTAAVRHLYDEMHALNDEERKHLYWRSR